MRVTTEAIKRIKLIPQCKRCQEYGNTQKYCNIYVCQCMCHSKVHFTNECKKPKSTIPKCTSCSEQHPVNYQGCQVAKKLQKNREE